MHTLLSHCSVNMRRTSLFPRALSHRIIPSHIRTVKPLPERCATRYLYSSSLPTQTPCQNIPAKTKPRRVALNYLQRSFLHSKVPASSTTARKIARKEPQPAKPTKTSTQGVISFPSVNVMTLNIPLPDHQETMFSIKTHVPIGMLLSNIMDEHPWVVDAAVYEPDDAGKLGYRWASATCIDDVVREAVRGAQKGFILVLNGEHHISIQIPPFEERANSLIQQLKSKEEEYSQMFNIKEECDGKAAKTSRKVNYAGLAFLVGQWGILARMTYWEFSWDVMEPICYFLTSGNAIVGYIFYIFFKKEFTYENLHDVNFTKQQVTLYEKAALDVRRYYELKGEIQARKEELEKIKSEYD